MADLIKKLGVREGQLICLLVAPDEVDRLLRQNLPASVVVHTTLQSSRYDMILFWPPRLEGLGGEFGSLEAHLRPNGAIWAVMPKKKFARQRGIDYTWEQLQAAGLANDLVDNKVATISEQDYATRFVIRKKSRHLVR